MCWMALIPIAIGAVSGLMQGKAGEAQADSQADALRRNAMYMNNAAQDAKVRGMKDADWARVNTQSLIGSQRAGAASNGGVVDAGSNAWLQQDTAQLGELDALTISNNAAREAYGYEVQAADNIYTAKNLQTQAKKNTMSSVLGGALGGASQSFGAGSFGGGGGAATSGLNMQGQAQPLYNNTAFVKRM